MHDKHFGRDGVGAVDVDDACKLNSLRGHVNESNTQQLLRIDVEKSAKPHAVDQQLPAETREVYDVSGAGDSVLATLAAMLANDKALKEAVSLANRAGGIVVNKIGAATVSREELFRLDNK